MIRRLCSPGETCYCSGRPHPGIYLSSDLFWSGKESAAWRYLAEQKDAIPDGHTHGRQDQWDRFALIYEKRKLTAGQAVLLMLLLAAWAESEGQ